MNAAASVLDTSAVARFLSSNRIALVGASDDPKRFSHTVFNELVSRGFDVVPVNPSATSVAGRGCYANVGEIPVTVDGALIMVASDRAPEAVRECVTAGIRRIWLFKGLGGAGATSELATALCHDAGVDLVDGACPLMFLEPVGWFHRVHRAARRVHGGVT
jgi:predicted CoA-binding protein